jgi:hypothetical protein
LILSTNERIYLKWLVGLENKNTLKKRFINEQYAKLLKDDKRIANKYYIGKESLDDKVASDLERKKLQARIRFMGYKMNYNNLVEEWCGYDTLSLVAALLLFILLLIIGR